jgi:hypothetical protein
MKFPQNGVKTPANSGPFAAEQCDGGVNPALTAPARGAGRGALTQNPSSIIVPAMNGLTTICGICREIMS